MIDTLEYRVCKHLLIKDSTNAKLSLKFGIGFEKMTIVLRKLKRLGFLKTDSQIKPVSWQSTGKLPDKDLRRAPDKFENHWAIAPLIR